MAEVMVTARNLMEYADYTFPEGFGAITGSEVVAIQHCGFTKLIKWCGAHCQGSFSWDLKRGDLTFKFNDPQDAMLFKLTWL